jgi:hypothetical protein
MAGYWYITEVEYVVAPVGSWCGAACGTKVLRQPSPLEREVNTLIVEGWHIDGPVTMVRYPVMDRTGYAPTALQRMVKWEWHD